MGRESGLLMGGGSLPMPESPIFFCVLRAVARAVAMRSLYVSCASSCLSCVLERYPISRRTHGI